MLRAAGRDETRVRLEQSGDVLSRLDGSEEENAVPRARGRMKDGE